MVDVEMAQDGLFASTYGTPGAVNFIMLPVPISNRNLSPFTSSSSQAAEAYDGRRNGMPVPSAVKSISSPASSSMRGKYTSLYCFMSYVSIIAGVGFAILSQLPTYRELTCVNVSCQSQLGGCSGRSPSDPSALPTPEMSADSTQT